MFRFVHKKRGPALVRVPLADAKTFNCLLFLIMIYSTFSDAKVRRRNEVRNT